MDSNPYNQSPGPNAYKLPPVVGYPDHDISRWRNPAYSMGVKTTTHGTHTGPGPAYTLDKMTRFGRAYIPGTHLGQRYPHHKLDSGPGPGAYNPDISNLGKVKRSGPTFGVRPDDVGRSTGPGPGAYGALKDPMSKNTPAVTFGGRPDTVQKHSGPGPNSYNPKPQQKVKTITFGSPPAKVSDRDTGPGPGAYQSPEYLKYNPRGKIPTFAFGSRPTNTPYVTPEDNPICELICRRN